jgi:hypothetical protein
MTLELAVALVDEVALIVAVILMLDVKLGTILEVIDTDATWLMLPLVVAVTVVLEEKLVENVPVTDVDAPLLALLLELIVIDALIEKLAEIVELIEVLLATEGLVVGDMDTGELVTEKVGDCVKVGVEDGRIH